MINARNPAAASQQVLENKPVQTRQGGGRAGAPAPRVAECLIGDESGTMYFTARNEQGARPAFPCTAHSRIGFLAAALAECCRGNSTATMSLRQADAARLLRLRLSARPLLQTPLWRIEDRQRHARSLLANSSAGPMP